ncbi:MAG: carboxypeptidase-like regulatory domain-containing protein [Acidobacteriota bacterium]|nr:carboxypeptidase-like regulatory domain-containing protein [Acidobacteriota bacterium]
MRTLMMLAAICALAVGDANAGAPLKGIDVKLGKNPGGGAGARVTTDGSGHFSLGVQPAGSYTLTLESENDAALTVNGAVGGTIRKTSGMTTHAAVGRRIHHPITVILKSDGKTPLTGSVETAVVKSKSNISNN